MFDKSQSDFKQNGGQWTTTSNKTELRKRPFESLKRVEDLIFLCENERGECD